MKLISIIQARSSSKRLKNKVMKKIKNKMIIEYVYDCVNNSKLFDNIIIATSKSSADDKIIKWCKKNEINFFRGNLNNVSKRFYDICKKNKFDYFLRVCSDSPLLDMGLVKSNLRYLNKYQIVTNCFKKTYPKGQSVEIISKKCFIDNFKYFKKKHQEHVTNFFYENSSKFKIKNFFLKSNMRHIGLSIDTISDFKKIKKILSKIKKASYKYSYKKYIEFYKQI